MATKHRFVEHVGEIEVELEAATEEGLFVQALRAFAELVEAGGEGVVVRHEIELEAEDDALLLVDWLSELVFLAEVERFVPDRVTRFELADGCLRAQVVGRRGNPRHLVKAVTLSGLDVRREGGMWRGRVVLDV